MALAARYPAVPITRTPPIMNFVRGFTTGIYRRSTSCDGRHHFVGYQTLVPVAVPPRQWLDRIEIVSPAISRGTAESHQQVAQHRSELRRRRPFLRLLAQGAGDGDFQLWMRIGHHTPERDRLLHGVNPHQRDVSASSR